MGLSAVRHDDKTKTNHDQMSSDFSPLNILQAIPELETGGAERTTVDITRAIVEAGGKAIVASLGGRLEAELTAAGGYLERLDMATKNPITIWLNAGKLAELIKRHNVTLIHARSRAPAWSAYIAARRCHIPYIATYHGTYSANTSLKRAYNRIMVKGEKVIANSEFIADLIEREYHLSKEQIVTIPRGTDFAPFDPHKIDPKAKTRLRASWGLREDDTRQVILLPGRLTRWKGQGDLIEAAAHLRAKGQSDFVCILAGDAQGRDTYQRELEELIEKHDLGSHIHLVGHCSDMPTAYAVADVVVSASVKPEAFGRIAVEAQAMMTPVVVTDHGGARETVLDGQSGWRIPPNAPETLAGTLLDALTLTPEKRRKMGENGRNHALKAYSVNQMCAKTLAVYKDVLQQKIDFT